MSRPRRPRVNFTRDQDNAIIYWIKNGDYNNIGKSCDDLAELDLFENKTSNDIYQHYYNVIRKNYSLFNIVSTINGANNYKNNPIYWRRAS